MTIENASIIDAIGTDKTTGMLHLSIVAHLPWDRPVLLLLQEKINRYLGFIDSGELISSYPDGVGRNIAIDVFCKFRPTDEVIEFFGKGSAVAHQYGALLRYTHSGSGYADDAA